MTRLNWMGLALTMGLVGCGAPETSNRARNASPAQIDNTTAILTNPAVVPARAVAPLQTAEGARAGTATATAGEGRIMVALTLEGLPPGHHGAHVHMAGRCHAPTFESAGSHWNPTNAQHGLENPRGQHAGDMPNVDIDGSGRGSLDYTLVGGSLGGLLDADGAAMVIHASADDQRTDPSGNSGARIACGVFAAG